MELTILMPCLNEAETLKTCIDKAQSYLTTENIEGEVLIADNGSTDGSLEIAKDAGARIVNVPVKGYGAALIHGIEEAKGKYVIMGDSDDSYDFSRLQLFVQELRKGSELVMGNRFRGGIKKGAMPFLHRYLGNPVLSFIGRLFFNIPIGDFHCGLRGFNRAAILRLGLRTTGMEFASEMVVKAALYNLKFTEVPTVLSPDGRSRPPHLRTWRDGWRHLRFLLIYSPKWLFLYPGLTLIFVGLLFTSLLVSNPVKVGSLTFDIHTLLYSNLFIIIGFQSALFYFLSKTFAVTQDLIPSNNRFQLFWKYINLEIGLVVGVLLCLLGAGTTLFAFDQWRKAEFGVLDPSKLMRLTIPSVTIIILGVQVIFFSFFLSTLGIKTDKK